MKTVAARQACDAAQKHGRDEHLEAGRPGRRRFLCAWMPYFATDRVRRTLAAAQSRRPLILVRYEGSSAWVEAADPQAAKLGLRPGMRLAEALAVAHELEVRPCDPPADAAALRALAGWADRFSPVVEPRQPDMLLMDVTGCGPLFGSEASLAEQVRQGLLAQGFSARVAIAETVAAARVLARGYGRTPVVCPPGHLRRWLEPLPISALDPTPADRQKLDSLGIETLGQLFALPRDALARRLGAALVRELAAAVGERIEFLEGHQPQPPVSASRRWEDPLSDAQRVRHSAGQMLARLCNELTARGLALEQLDLIVISERHPPRCLEIRLARPVVDREHVGRLLALRLEALDLGDGLVGLQLRARRTRPYFCPQAGLFEPHTDSTAEALARFVDHATHKLGPAAIRRTRQVESYVPERACEWLAGAPTPIRVGVPTTPASHLGSGQVGSPAAGMQRGQLPRPACLLPRPVPVRAVSLVPDGPATWFCWRGQEQRVVRAWGPERIESGWWGPADVRRDYFQVLTERGERFWMFRCLRDGRWYVHGWFG